MDRNEEIFLNDIRDVMEKMDEFRLAEEVNHDLDYIPEDEFMVDVELEEESLTLRTMIFHDELTREECEELMVKMDEFEKQMPELFSVLAKISAASPETRESVIQNLWQDLKVETIDYGVMEKAEKVAVLPASGLGWSDVGSWDSLFEVLLPDMNGNISINAQHLALETHNTLVFGSGTDRLIVTIGIDDMVVVDKGDAILICKSDQSQKVKAVVTHLKKHHQEKYL